MSVSLEGVGPLEQVLVKLTLVNYACLLMQLIATDLPEEHRLAPAVNFKNFVKAHWVRPPQSSPWI